MSKEFIESSAFLQKSKNPKGKYRIHKRIQNVDDSRFGEKIKFYTIDDYETYKSEKISRTKLSHR